MQFSSEGRSGGYIGFHDRFPDWRAIRARRATRISVWGIAEQVGPIRVHDPSVERCATCDGRTAHYAVRPKGVA